MSNDINVKIGADWQSSADKLTGGLGADIFKYISIDDQVLQ